MCTLIVALGLDPQRPLVVAANRDEQRARPAEGPAPRMLSGVPCFAPVDREGGGTWMGLGHADLFVALTNRFGPTFPDRRSRGDVVVEALAHPDVAAARQWASSLEGSHERGFHLVVASRREGFVAIADGRTTRVRNLVSGEVRVITERAFEAAPSERQNALEQRFASATPKDLQPEALRALLASRDGGPFDSVNVDVPDMGYGTRSSALITLPAQGEPQWMGTEGPPDLVPWRAYEVSFPAPSAGNSSP